MKQVINAIRKYKTFLITAHVNLEGDSLGSQLAIATLGRYGIRHHFKVVVPYISKDESGIMCPMEKLSMGKTPQEFYEAIKKSPSREGSC